MKLVKKIGKFILYLLAIPAAYGLVAMLLTAITIDRTGSGEALTQIIFLHTNGVHLDIAIPIADIDSMLLTGLKHTEEENYLSFGWGDENFYLNTPTWGDLTFRNGFNALFLNSSTLIHVTRYKQKRARWIAIKVSEVELGRLNAYLLDSFSLDENGDKVLLEGQGYTSRDDFYKAKGSYSCLHTCNSWVNTGFKQSGLKACLWTPVDVGLMNKYR
ncbi:MAG: DUF2459 domain-containing protein [Bacteroidota bacterium]